MNRLLIKCIIRYEEYFKELALIVSCRVHQSDVDLDNVDAPEEEVEEDMETKIISSLTSLKIYL